VVTLLHRLRSKALLSALSRRHDCNPFKSFLPLLAQGPLFVCFFLAIKRMSELPSFEHGGAAWFTNLSVADPLFIMPLLSGATFLATVEARPQPRAVLVSHARC
jgi:YidC/Oxa1 family membrane protein insertase